MPTRSVATGVLGGVVLGVVLAVAVVASGWLDRSEPEHGDEAIASFLEAWRGHRDGTYVVDATFVRTTPDGGRLESAVHVAQRPPERVAVQFESVDATVDGRPLRCLEGEDDGGAPQLYCAPSEQGADHDEVVAEELRVWLGYLVGERPLYDVASDGEGCFDLDRVRDLPYLPYGDHARFCFDEETGAMTSSRIERVEATDVMEATSVRAEVTDDDLLLPAQEQPPEEAPPGG
jgi:hypothetical protein